MNIKNIFSAILGFSLMFSACTSEEVDVVSPKTNTPGVYLRLSGAATAKATSRATVAAEDGEKTVNNLLAVLFDTHDGFYKTVPAVCIDEDTNEYTFIVEEDATYDIWLVANASDKLKTDLGNIPAGTPFENSETGENCLNSIIADQAPDAEANFLMVSKYSEKITTRITESQSIGEIHMIRLAARFDLLNKAENVTVTSISFANRTVKSAVLTPNTASTIADWYESKDYEVNVTGEPENGNEWNGHIYTYENYSTEDNKPELTISYYEGSNSTDIKTHVVKLIDPNSTSESTMPIKRNNLYRIILTKATKLDFKVEVADWDDAEPAIEYPELPLYLPKDVQDSLNRQLLVYDLFTDYNVKKIDFDNNTVEFFDNYSFEPEVLKNDKFYSYDELKSKNMLKEGVYFTDANGNKYRIPTAGETMLLVPSTLKEGFALTVRMNEKYSINTNETQEYVYLKNDANNNRSDIDHDITEENEYGFTGLSQLRKGKGITLLTFDANSNYTTNEEDIVTRDLNTPVYGIRFKGTKQYAAYKWECIYLNNIVSNRALSIKIKALPKDTNITLDDDIVDNHSYWKDGYIELIFPLYGYYPVEYNYEQLAHCTRECSLITSTYSKSGGYYDRCLIMSQLTHITTGGAKTRNVLRLVKVKQQTVENE